MHRIAAVLNLLTQLNKSSTNNFIRHECQNGILGGCFFILFDGYELSKIEKPSPNDRRGYEEALRYNKRYIKISNPLFAI